jgi:hypothetical protein
MSDRIAKAYTNFLEYENRMKKKGNATQTAAMSTRGFMSPKGNKPAPKQSSKLSELDRVAQLVGEIRKAREV